MSTPIDLRAEFGHRWKIGLDEAAAGRWKDPWHFLILCQYGVIVPWGGDLLGASTTSTQSGSSRRWPNKSVNPVPAQHIERFCLQILRVGRTTANRCSGGLALYVPVGLHARCSHVQEQDKARQVQRQPQSAC